MVHFIHSLTVRWILLFKCCYYLQVDHFVDSNDVASVSEHDSDSDSDTEVVRRPRGGEEEGGGGGNRRTDDRTSSIPHSRTATFKDAELERDVSGSFGGGYRFPITLDPFQAPSLRVACLFRCVLCV